MKKFLAFILCVLISNSLSAQFNLKGLVLSASTFATIPNATVTLNKEDGQFVQRVYSDKNGFFFMANIAPGSYKLEVYETGYKPGGMDITISQNKLDLLIELKPLQVVGDEVIIESIKNKKPLGTTHTNLDKAQVQRLNYSQDLPVILSTTPSAVYTSDAGGGVGYSGVRIRGVDATRVNVTINGVPFNDPESHAVFWVDLPDLAGSVNSIQVQRGIGSSTNGSAAFGSSINIETTKSSVDPFAQYTISYGSFNTLKNNIKFGSGILKNHWTFEGSLTSITSDGYIDRATSNLKSGYGSITRYGDKSLLKFIMMRGSEVTYQAWDGVPQDSLKTNRTFNGFNYKNETDNYTQSHYQLIYSYVFNPRLTTNTVIHYTKGKGYYENFYRSATLANYGMPNYHLTDSTSGTSADLIARKWLDNDFIGVVSSVIYRYKKYELNTGISYNNYYGLHYHEVIWSDVWTAPKPNGLYEPYRYFNDKGIKNDGNIYGKLFYNYSRRMTFFVDLQLRMLTYNFNDLLSKNMTKKYLFFNPKMGMNYTLRDSSKVLVYFGRSAHEPTRVDFVRFAAENIPQAEYLKDIEIGYFKVIKKWNFTANFYNMIYRNQLVLTGKVNDVGSTLSENVKKSYRRGLELILQRKFAGGISINANATYSKNIIKDYKEVMYNFNYDSITIVSYKSTPISYSPKFIFGASIRYTTKQNFDLEFISKYVSSQFLDNSGSDDRKLNSYFVNDFYLRYHYVKQKLVDDLVISGVIYNIFNTNYESNGYTYGNINQGVRTSYNYYFPQALQNFAVMLQVRF